jgi:ABC-type xylose transport system permease subunit
MSDDYVPPSNVVARTGAGIVGGLAGGVVLGAVLQVLGEVRDVGRLAGSSTARGSWLVLLALCLVAGGLFGGLLGGWVSRQLVPAVGIGLIYGGVCWVVLALLVVPLRTGGRLFDIDGSMIELVAYAAFGMITAAVYAVAGPRRRYWYGPRRSWGLVYAVPAVRRRRRRRNDDDD